MANPFSLSPAPKTRKREEDKAEQQQRSYRPAKLHRKSASTSTVMNSPDPKPTRPPLIRSTSSLVILTAALDIFSRRPKEALLDEEAPFPIEVVKVNERRMPSLLSLSSMIRRSSMDTSTIYDVPAALPPGYMHTAATSIGTPTPSLISPTASEFSDASSNIITPTSAIFDQSIHHGMPVRESFETARLPYDDPDCVEEEESGQSSNGGIGMIKSPVLYEGHWGHGQVGMAF
ncbi:hypothetical protein JCM11641_003994 [Rhodosporidiobolus odoratus]